jgi:aminobenzoyl-glutamate transport protein
MFENVEANFVKFPPLGLVLVAMIGIGVAEGSGLLGVFIRALVLKAPKRLITGPRLGRRRQPRRFGSRLCRAHSTRRGDLPALGRHPMAGLAAAFAGVSGGFGANFVIGERRSRAGGPDAERCADHRS